jgi:hypothetical protein
MALQLEYIKKDQTTGNYWRINKIQWDTVENSIFLTLALYKDQNARINATNFPMQNINLFLDKDKHPLTIDSTENTSSANLRALFYSLIKANKIKDEQGKYIDFSNAIDV